MRFRLAVQSILAAILLAPPLLSACTDNGNSDDDVNCVRTVTGHFK